jgi:hypothetical protein
MEQIQDKGMPFKQAQNPQAMRSGSSKITLDWKAEMTTQGFLG